MADTVSREERSRIMSKIRGKDTGPEMLIRKALHARGFRYRLHDRRLPGRPDLVFPRYGAVVFINGCFWHMHGCHLSSIPKTRTKFWRKKLEDNRERDRRNTELLLAAGWRVAHVWECSIRDRAEEKRMEAVERLAEWLRSDRKTLSIP